jgi:hypothetical protein
MGEPVEDGVPSGSRNTGHGLSPEAPAEAAVDAEPELDVALAEVSELRQRVEAHEMELAALQAELTGARQEQERTVASLRAELAETQRGRIEAYRRALVAEHAGQIVEELVTGDTPEELEASLEIAQATYARALEAARQGLSATLTPIGASPRPAARPDEMSPIAKISAALGRNR